MSGRNKFRFALVVALMTFQPLFAALADGVGTHWASIVDAVIGNGVSRIGDFSLTQFRKQASRIRWTVIDGAPASVISGSRQSAFYLRGKGKAYVSRNLPSGEPASIAQLELHEALGATGYNDNDYSLTLALTTLAEVRSADERDRLLQSYQGIFRRTIRVAMGGTSVSGGGDLPIIEVKRDVLELVKGGSYGSVSREFLSMYPLIGFEPMRTGGSVVLKYNSYVRGNRAGRRESLSVWIPKSRLNEGSRQALVAEIAEKITGIFPARDGAVRTFHPTECGPGVTATYPATNDPQVASIQNIRAAIQLGCYRPFIGETGSSYTAPGVTREDEPRQPGSFVFECQFRYGSSHLEYQLNAAAGVSSLNSQGWSIDGTDHVFGMAHVSRAGRLDMITIVYASNGQSRRATPVRVTGNSGMASMEINGQTLTYACQESR